jgi:Zn-dependent protease/predicted transcriptional regulator
MSLQIGKIRGIPIRLHFTLLIVFSLVTWTLAASFMPELFPGLPSAEYWIMGIVGAALLFTSVLLHELSHSIVAMKYGIRVRQIILFIFGGVSDIEKETRHPAKEIRIALAGPIVSFMLAAVFAASWWLLTTFAPGTLVVVEGIAFYGAVINTMLGLFNLVPAFPLDGGRILRAALIGRMRDFDKATDIAVRVGIAISYGFMALGFIVVITGGFLAGIWLLLIGWFLQSGAQSYKFQHDLMVTLSNVRLADIMNPSFIAIPPKITLLEAQSNYFAVQMKSAFPVVGVQGRLLGMITIKRLRDVDAERRQSMKVEEAMIPREDLAVMQPDRKGNEAAMGMARDGYGKVFVCDEEGRLLGLVTKTDIMSVMRERQEYEKTAAK